MNTKPLVSVIIVNYNGKFHLEQCLESIMKIDYTNFEIILVDNNSVDDSIEYVKNNYPSVMIIKLDNNYGFAEPNNIGAKNAKGDLLLFLNNDTIVTPNFISELVSAMEKDPKIVIAQSLLMKPNGDIDSSGDFIDVFGRAYSSRIKTDNTRLILSARGASMMVRKKIFFDLDGFDKNFFASFEDVDLGWRACICGYKVVLVPSSVVYHKTGSTIMEIAKEIQFHSVKNSLVLRLVNFEFFNALKSILVLFTVFIFRKLFGVNIIKNPEPLPPLPSYKIIFEGSTWVLKNFKYVLSKRKKINLQRKRSTKELIEMGLITKTS